MAFEGLSEKLNAVFKSLKGKGRLTEADVRTGMREVRLALLEADVSYKVVKDFVAQVTERCVGSDVLDSLTPAQQIIKIVNQELTALMGGTNARLTTASKGELAKAKAYLGLNRSEGFAAGMLRGTLASCARLAVIPAAQAVAAQIDAAAVGAGEAEGVPHQLRRVRRGERAGKALRTGRERRLAADNGKFAVGHQRAGAVLRPRRDDEGHRRTAADSPEGGFVFRVTGIENGHRHVITSAWYFRRSHRRR